MTDKPAGEITEAGTMAVVTQCLEVPRETVSPLYSEPPNAASSSALRAERLSPDEARAVIDLWQAEQVEQTGLTDRPAVPDMAEGLDLSVEDVQRLLAEVRTRREAESRLLAQEQELAQVRLAEEQHKLAEIQRQRAELRRERAKAEQRGADPWWQESDLWRLSPESRSLPPRRPLRRLPQEGVPCWQGAAAFSPEDEAAELLAEHRAEEERGRKETNASWPLIAFLILVPLSVYLWAVLVQH